MSFTFVREEPAEQMRRIPVVHVATKWEEEGNTIGDPELDDNLKEKIDAGTLKIEEAE